ncbi:MAG: rod shape-determining protein MreC [Planctomycetes bacterium]|nr:rod shape-determining protein MreC [Planctomycetota bacterium]
MPSAPSNPSRLLPLLLATSLAMLLVPQAQVLTLRSHALSALSPLLTFFHDATRGLNAPPTASAEAPASATPAGVPDARVRDLEIRCARLADENARLQAMLAAAGFGQPRAPRGVAARVIAREGRSGSTLWGLDQGSAEGVAVGAGVLYGGMALGRIVSVGPHASCVAPLAHEGLRLPARLAECQAEGVLQGGADEWGRPRCRLRLVAAELRARVGEAVVTTGREAGFPPSCFLGQVTALRRLSEMEWELDVQPAWPERAIEAVVVFRPEAAEIPWPAERKR